MSHNPFINALCASAYVSLAAFTISHLPQKDPTLATMGPLLFLSAFVFSAGLTGYVFCYQPLLLAMRGESAAGGALFLKTLGAFALVTAVLAGVYLGLGSFV